MSSSEERESDEDILPEENEEIQEAARAVIENLLPPKSKEKYIKTYDNFVQWRNERKSKSLAENVFLAYFSELSKKVKPSTLWVIYAMLRCTVSMHHNVNLKNYKTLTSMLKRQSDGYKCTKSNVLSGANVNKFLKEAPDSEFLDVKVVLIFGIYGACRCNEITNICIGDVESHEGVIIVSLRKTKIDRTFVIRDEPAELVQKYIALRRIDIKTDRFFLNYKNNKCTKQVIGRHKIANMPKIIATYLNLPDPEGYTGHCFRRSSATVLDDTNANLITLIRQGGSRSEPETESIEEPNLNKSEIGSKSAPETASFSEESNECESDTGQNSATEAASYTEDSNKNKSNIGCKSEPGDERYIEESNENKSIVIKIERNSQPSPSKVPHASTSQQRLEPQDDTEDTPSNMQQTWTSLELSQTNIIPGKSTLTFKNCTFNNCTFKGNHDIRR